MSPTREQVIAMVREAGFVGYGEDDGDYNIPAPAFLSRLGRVIEAARAQALEEAARVCDEPGIYTKHDMQQAIRALRGTQ